jgi:prepilin peptidase CpaA
MGLEYCLLLTFPGLMAFAAMMDFFTMKIPNYISTMLVVSFLLISPLTGMVWEHYLFHLGSGFAVLALGVVLFAIGIVGGGDAKLMAAATVWLGPENLPQYVLITALIGGVLSVALVMYRWVALPRWLLVQDWASRLHNRKEGIPYGLALAGGALWIFPSTDWFNGIAT